MPTIEELEDAIEQLSTMPTSFDNCLKLSVYHNLLNVIESQEEPHIEGLSYTSDTDFMKTASDVDINKLFSIVDELFECLKIVSPKLYDSAMFKLKN